MSQATIKQAILTRAQMLFPGDTKYALQLLFIGVLELDFQKYIDSKAFEIVCDEFGNNDLLFRIQEVSVRKQELVVILRELATDLSYDDEIYEYKDIKVKMMTEIHTSLKFFQWVS